MPRGGSGRGQGRKFGSTNKNRADLEGFVDRCFDAYKKRLGIEGNPEEYIVTTLLTCGNPTVIERVWGRLMDYRYGKPAMRVEGADGGPLRVILDTAVSPHIGKALEAK